MQDDEGQELAVLELIEETKDQQRNLPDLLLDRKELSVWPTRWNIAKNAALGVQYLHHHPKAPQILGKLQVKDILIRPNGTAVINDTGFRFQETYTTKARTEKPYFAPEWYEEKEITPAADVFALGMIFGAIVTRKLPFHGRLCHPRENHGGKKT